METQTPNLTPASSQDASKRITQRKLGYSWNDYFMQKTDGDVWIQNLTDMQISLDIEVAPGQTQGKLVPPSPDPVNLTEDFDFAILKKSTNFRRALAKRRAGRPDMILLDAEQVETYYQARAKQLNAYHPDGSPNVEAAMMAAEEQRKFLTTRAVDGQEVSPSNSHNFAPPKSAQELISMDLATRGIFSGEGQLQSTRMQAGVAMPGQVPGSVAMTEVVKPKILFLCQQVSPQVPENMRMRAEDLLAALQSIPNKSLDDYQHIEAYGMYRGVKRWARQCMSEIASGDEGIPDNLSVGGQALVGKAERQGAIVPIGVPQGFGPQGPATLAAQGMTYQGPQGFVNAGFQEARGHVAESMVTEMVGPNGQPIG
jgi:hypothetical protein